MDFFVNELFKIGNFSVALWHILVVVAVIVVLTIVIVGICSRKKAQKASAEQPTQEVEQVESASSVPASAEDVVITEELDEDVDEDVEVDETADETVDETPMTPTETVDESGEQAPKRPTVKNYHVSIRRDGKWQVKLSKGGKAIKLFDTQAQAIEFAKARAKSQDGHITIHKVDGKIRKQKY